MFDQPKMEDFVDADGYIDFEAYDVHWNMWRDSIPNLYESWCPEVVREEPEEPNTLRDLIEALLA